MAVKDIVTSAILDSYDAVFPGDSFALGHDDAFSWYYTTYRACLSVYNHVSSLAPNKNSLNMTNCSGLYDNSEATISVRNVTEVKFILLETNEVNLAAFGDKPRISIVVNEGEIDILLDKSNLLLGDNVVYRPYILYELKDLDPERTYVISFSVAGGEKYSGVLLDAILYSKGGVALPGNMIHHLISYEHTVRYKDKRRYQNNLLNVHTDGNIAGSVLTDRDAYLYLDSAEMESYGEFGVKSASHNIALESIFGTLRTTAGTSNVKMHRFNVKGTKKVLLCCWTYRNRSIDVKVAVDGDMIPYPHYTSGGYLFPKSGGYSISRNNWYFDMGCPYVFCELDLDESKEHSIEILNTGYLTFDVAAIDRGGIFKPFKCMGRMSYYAGGVNKCDRLFLKKGNNIYGKKIVKEINTGANVGSYLKKTVKYSDIKNNTIVYPGKKKVFFGKGNSIYGVDKKPGLVVKTINDYAFADVPKITPGTNISTYITANPTSYVGGMQALPLDDRFGFGDATPTYKQHKNKKVNVNGSGLIYLVNNIDYYPYYGRTGLTGRNGNYGMLGCRRCIGASGANDGYGGAAGGPALTATIGFKTTSSFLSLWDTLNPNAYAISNSIFVVKVNGVIKLKTTAFHKLDRTYVAGVFAEVGRIEGITPDDYIEVEILGYTRGTEEVAQASVSTGWIAIDKNATYTVNFKNEFKHVDVNVTSDIEQEFIENTNVNIDRLGSVDLQSTMLRTLNGVSDTDDIDIYIENNTEYLGVVYSNADSKMNVYDSVSGVMCDFAMYSLGELNQMIGEGDINVSEYEVMAEIPDVREDRFNPYGLSAKDYHLISVKNVNLKDMINRKLIEETDWTYNTYNIKPKETGYKVLSINQSDIKDGSTVFSSGTLMVKWYDCPIGWERVVPTYVAAQQTISNTTPRTTYTKPIGVGHIRILANCWTVYRATKCNVYVDDVYHGTFSTVSPTAADETTNKWLVYQINDLDPTKEQNIKVYNNTTGVSFPNLITPYFEIPTMRKYVYVKDNINYTWDGTNMTEVTDVTTVTATYYPDDRALSDGYTIKYVDGDGSLKDLDRVYFIDGRTLHWLYYKDSVYYYLDGVTLKPVLNGDVVELPVATVEPTIFKIDGYITSCIPPYAVKTYTEYGIVTSSIRDDIKGVSL